MPRLECTAVETYRHFEVLNKGNGSKRIIFHVIGKMDNHSILEEEDTDYESRGPKFTPQDPSPA